MHLDETAGVGEGKSAGHEELLVAVRDATREACHLAALAGKVARSDDAGIAAREASVEASRAVFALEDAMREIPRERAPPVTEALAALAAAEEALASARLALEHEVTRTIRLAGPAPERPA